MSLLPPMKGASNRLIHLKFENCTFYVFVSTTYTLPSDLLELLWLNSCLCYIDYLSITVAGCTRLVLSFFCVFIALAVV